MPILPCQNPFGNFIKQFLGFVIINMVLICKAPKKAPPRKATSKSVLKFDAAERARQLGMDYTNPSLRLDDQIQLTFEPDTAEWSNGLFTLSWFFQIISY